MNVDRAVDRFLVLFPSIVFEALPFIIVGALISGTLEELLPQQWIARFIPKRKARAIAGSALLGLVFPMCECGIVPVMRRLLGKGLPLSCAVAYMLAAPIINPVVIASTWAAFSGDRRVETGGDGLTSAQMVALRVGLAFIVAFVVGLIVERLVRRTGSAALIMPIHGHRQERPEHTNEPRPQVKEEPVEKTEVHDAAATPELQKKTLLQRLMSISETALHDFVDITCFLILGAFLASLVRTFNIMETLPILSESAFLAVPAMMALAIVLCLCSEADAFVAANLIAIPLGGKLAFLVLGPMLDFKLYFMYTRVFRARLIWTIIPSVLALVLVLTLAAHYLDQFASPR